VKIQVEGIWVVTSCSIVVRYQCFRGQCKLVTLLTSLL